MSKKAIRGASEATDHTQKDERPMNDGASIESPQASPLIPPLHEHYFTSFSANFEDVILQRIFGKKAQGFYVDVGAAHPLFENDTKLFYDRGWNGINIEPNKFFFEQLKSERSRDHNFCLAISESVDQINFYEVVGTGLSTCDEKQAEDARAKGHEIIRHSVPTAALSAVLDQVAPSSIDFLKIDVEGLEQQVLASNNWEKYQPSVILLEATFPESPIRRPTQIRPYLESRGYRWRYFDGLNDFYVAPGFEVPDDVFDRPPNVFDSFRLRATLEMEQHISNLNAALRESQNYAQSLATDKTYAILQTAYNKAKIEIANERFERHRLSVSADSMRKELVELHSELERWIDDRRELLHLREAHANDVNALQAERAPSAEQIVQLRARVVDLEANRVAMLNSRSWRLTRPVRVIGSLLRRLRNRLR